jgi:hypothetical protein
MNRHRQHHWQLLGPADKELPSRGPLSSQIVLVRVQLLLVCLLQLP